MESYSAAVNLTEGIPVRRLAWGPGEYIINDNCGLTYCKSHAETYNSPIEKTSYSFSLDDIMADDWVIVSILPPHGYLLKLTSSEVNFYFKPIFFWLASDAIEEKRKMDKKYPTATFDICKVTKNLFGFGEPLP